MTIKLSSAEEHELVVKLAEGIETTSFPYGYVSSADLRWADALLSTLPDDARSKIDRYIGEHGLSTFIDAEISQRMLRLPIYPKIVKGDRAAVVPFLQSPLPFAKELVRNLRRIPMRYRVTVALPSVAAEFVIDEAQNTVLLPAGIVISKGDSLPGEMPMHTAFTRVEDRLFNDWTSEPVASRDLRSDLLYLSLPINGYAYARGSSALARSAEDHLRALYGAGIAIKLFDYLFDEPKIEKEHSYIMIHDEETRELLATNSQEEELIERRRYCSTLGFSKRNEGDLRAAYGSTLKKIGTIFYDNTDCRKLFAACIWFYRAKINRRPLDALLQATIAIEVMLGDRKAAEGIGLTNLLESRCAYLLGRSSTDRAKIATNFRRVYDLRSQVVHEGRHTLKTGDRQIVNMALGLCASIISRELGMRAVDEATKS